MIQPKCLFFLLMVSIATFSGCSKDEQEPAKKLTLPLRRESAHFLYYFDSLDIAHLDIIEKRLEDNYDTIRNRFQTGALPKIKIAIWSDRKAFDDMQNNKYPGAAGYVNGKEEVRLFFTGPYNTAGGAVHEFVHAITLFVSEDSGNNPRWLWEAIAVYEARQFTDPKTLPYMVSGDYPTLTTLSNEQGTNQRIYQVGYTIAEYIIQNWGYEKLRVLIQSHGDIQKTLGISKETFEQQWYAFVQRTYL